MPLQTSGFQLSALERAPQIPTNVGVVDTKSIYGGVVDALKSYEVLRTAQAAQAATDAELTLARQKAETETGLLAPEAEARRARAGLFAGESAAAMPGVALSAYAKRAADLLSAAQASEALGNVPAMAATQGAEAQARRLQAEAVTPETVGAATRAKLAAETLAAQQAEQDLANIEGLGALKRAELQRKTAEAQVLGTPEMIGRMAEAKSFSGMPASTQSYMFAQKILNDPNSTPEQIQAAQIMMKTAPTASADPFLRGAQAYQAKRGTSVATLESALPKMQSGLESFRAKTENVDRLIDQAAALVSNYSTGFGSLFERMPESDARKLAGIIQSIEANIGFDALSEMRQNSPTGGALGNVSDYEGKRLSQTITSLDLGVDGGTFIDRLNDVRNFRRGSLERLSNAFRRDQETVQGYKTALPALTPNAATRAAMPKAPAVEIAGFKVTPVP